MIKCSRLFVVFMKSLHSSTSSSAKYYASSFFSKYKYNFEIKILLWKLPIAIGGVDKHHILLSNKFIKWIENSILNKQL